MSLAYQLKDGFFCLFVLYILSLKQFKLAVILCYTYGILWSVELCSVHSGHPRHLLIGQSLYYNLRVMLINICKYIVPGLYVRDSWSPWIGLECLGLPEILSKLCVHV